MESDDPQDVAETDGSWAILDELPTMVCGARADRAWDYFNRSWLEFTGRPLEQQAGDGWLSGIHPDDLACWREAWQATRETGGQSKLSFRLRRHDGQYRTVIGVIMPRRDAQGRLAGHILNSVEAAAGPHDYRALFENMREGVAVHEMVYNAAGQPADYRILDVNPAFCRHTGLSRARVVGKLATEAYGAGVPPYLEVYTEVVSTLRARSFESYFSPLERHFSVSAFPIAPGQFATVFADTTERSRMEEQFRQSQKMEAVGRLAGGIAHDFNNLLMIMLAHGDFALEQLDAGHPARANLDAILTAAQRAAALTGQLLTFSRKQVTQPEVVELNEVVTETGGMLRRILGEDIRLEIVRGRKLKHVRCDAGQVAQALLNLAVNARDAMPNGGTLTIETANVQLDTHGAGPCVMLAVRDTGVGMTREIQRHLFEPFFTTKPQGKGTGLGLPMVYGIVKQSGGEIRVRSRLGHGTTFRIYLPAVEQWDSSSAVEATAAARGTEAVLLAEDDPEVRRITVRLLEALGYRALAAENGDQALTLLRDGARTVDALITDIVMPGLGGAELAAEAQKLHPKLPVLFISGYPQAAAGARGLLHEENLLPKPFTAESLGRKLRQLLDSR
jgi:two-component system cell cycle sensor histidine kinase/response regulator CckA